jgi:cytochrome P450
MPPVWGWSCRKVCSRFSFPGPKLAALTLWYEFYYDIIHRGQYIWKIQELHRQYGPIIRINPYELHITDPEFYDVLYSNDKKVDKWDWGTKQFGIDLSVLGTPDHDTHRLRRAALNNFFSMQRTRTLQPVVQERVDALAKRFEQYKDSRNIVQLDNAHAAFTNGE